MPFPCHIQVEAYAGYVCIILVRNIRLFGLAIPVEEGWMEGMEAELGECRVNQTGSVSIPPTILDALWSDRGDADVISAGGSRICRGM